MVADDTDGPCSYLTLERGTRVIDRFGAEVGHVDRVLTLAGPFFDGIVVTTPAGSRFVDAPEVRRIELRLVHLSNTLDDVVERRLSHREVTDADRREVVDSLKLAYVGDLLTADELGDRIELAYEATTSAALEALLPE
jgi:hypothetical protein